MNLSLLEPEKDFDLYSHMKANIKNSTGVCEIHDSEFTIYCNAIKRSVCEVCRDSFHSNHSALEKKQLLFDKKQVDTAFSHLEKVLDETDVFSLPEKTLKEVKKKVENEFESIFTLLSDLKRRRLSEVESIFGIPKQNSNSLFNYIKKTKEDLYNFIDKEKNFYKLHEVEDDDNFSFLTLYDVYNEVALVTSHYIELINGIRSQFKKYDNLANNKYSNIYEAIESCIEEQKKVEILSSNLIVLDGSENDQIEIKRTLTNNLNSTNTTKKTSTNNLPNPKSSKNVINISSNKNISNLSSNKNMINLTSTNNIAQVNPNEDFKNSLASTYEKLSEDFYLEVRNKLLQIEEHNDNFKNSIYDSFKKTGSLLEIEKMLKVYEEKTSKRIQFNSQANSVKMSNSKASGLSRSKMVLKIASKPDKICLDKDDKDSKDSKNNSNSKSKNKLKEKEKEYMLKNKGKNDLEALEEEEDEENLTSKRKNNYDNDDNDSQIAFEDKDEQIDVGISKNKKLFDNKTLLKLNHMFKPKQTPKKETPNKLQSLPNKNDKKESEEEKFKNSKLVDILKENQKLSEQIKIKEDCNLKIKTIKKFYSFNTLEFVRKNFYRINKGYSSHLLFSKQSQAGLHHNEETVKVFEGTADIQIYDRERRKITRKTIKIDKKKYGTNIFLNGCRTYYCVDKLYISGGKDHQGDKNYFWSYDIKENKLEKLIDMTNPRSFHTMVYHENLRALIAFGGENNATCEMYDFYLNLWSPLPDLNFPRANVCVYLDKVGTFGYAICGLNGNITNPTYSDQIELLDLVDMNQGWAIVDYYNKSNVDLKMNENKVFPLTDDMLLIYGAYENRTINKTYVIFNLRTFEMAAVNESELGHFKLNTILNPSKNSHKSMKTLI